MYSIKNKNSAPKAFGGFSFGGNGGGSTFGSSFKPMAQSTPAAKAEGDEYEPPKVEEAEFDDAKDALYHKKAKIFYSKEGNYKEIGSFNINSIIKKVEFFVSIKTRRCCSKILSFFRQILYVLFFVVFCKKTFFQKILTQN